MPQMAPYSWINLFFLFNFILIYLISYIYTFNLNSIVLKKINLKKNYYNWKW